jgi:hypothetical protein
MRFECIKILKGISRAIRIEQHVKGTLSHAIRIRQNFKGTTVSQAFRKHQNCKGNISCYSDSALSKSTIPCDSDSAKCLDADHDISLMPIYFIYQIVRQVQ